MTFENLAGFSGSSPITGEEAVDDGHGPGGDDSTRALGNNLLDGALSVVIGWR